MKVKKTKARSSFLWVILALSLITNVLLIVKQKAPLPNIFEEQSGGPSVAVRRVIDGDTFDTSEGRRVRLAGVDAPEYQEGCYSVEARDALEKIILKQSLRLEEVAHDNFGRVVAYVFVGPVLVQEQLIREGVAKFRPGSKEEKYDPQLQKAQAEAETLKRGLWSSACENRRDPKCRIKANFRKQEGTHIYHLPECHNWDRIVIDERRGDRWFCTEAEARRAGFVKSGNCL